jgi:hypothetical protein
VRKTSRIVGLSIAALALLAARDYGPAIGTRMPEFALRDQDGKSRTLQNILGPKGAVLVFFRSADW